MKRMILAVILAGAAIAATAETPSVAQDIRAADEALAKKVRHELLMLPYLSVFDNMTFRVENGDVTLMGQVVRPTLASSAFNVVKRLEGVAHVSNQIEVLPLSNFDNRVRLSVARAVYGYTALQRYGLGANPPIRIIVKNGDVTLEGVVANEMDRNLAFMRANGVAGAFKVTNHLRVDGRA
ncbi:MAG: BON domain-containing protein [Bryobacteraceae bacterium]